MQHANLINNQDIGFFDNFAASLANMLGKTIRQAVANANTRPSMNRRAAQMRRRQPGSRRHRDILAARLAQVDELIQHESLARSCRAGQQCAFAAQ